LTQRGTTNPTTRLVAVTGVIVLETLDDLALVVAGVRRADLAYRQHDTDPI
jgi:hypothetical protein